MIAKDRYSPESYRWLLRQALDAGWRFRRFTDPPGDDHRDLYLRLDVDISMGMALEAARLNESLGVRGTFCLQLRSTIYNMLDEQSLQIARHIHEAGQSLALHCRLPAGTSLTAESLSRVVRHEFELLQRELPMLEPVFSWHNPTPETMALCREVDVAGIVNAYDGRFTQAMTYRSDSNLRHSPEDLAAVLRDPRVRSLQLLLHPVNWIAGGADMAEILANAWSWVVRERDIDLRTNVRYRELYPDGMPQAAIDALVEALRHAAADEETATPISRPVARESR